MDHSQSLDCKNNQTAFLQKRKDYLSMKLLQLKKTAIVAFCGAETGASTAGSVSTRGYSV